MTIWNHLATWQKVLLVALLILLLIFVSGMIHFPGDGGHTGPAVRVN